MKKLFRKGLAMLITVSVIASMLIGFNTCIADAASYTVGTRQDFETSFNTGDALVTFARDEYYGGVLKLESSSERSGGQISFDFSPAVKKGRYVLSFDLLMSDINTNMLMYTRKYNKDKDSFENMSFMALREGGKVCTYPNNQWSFPQIGSAAFEAGKWQRYDIIMDLDADNTTATKWGEFYVDGIHAGDINLTQNSINAMGKIQFVFADYNKKGEYALLDNVEMREYRASAAITGTRKSRGFEVDFSETVTGLSKSDFTLTRTATDSTETENVDFDIAYTTATKALIVPKDFKGGYTYTVTLADGVQSAFGNSFAENSFSCRIGKTVQTDREWNFEDGNAPGANTEIAEFENRGKALKYVESNEKNVDLWLDNPIDGGKYIYSYDLMRTAKTDAPYLMIRVFDETKEWQCFETLFDTGKFGNFGTSGDPKRGWGCMQIGEVPTLMNDGTWYRIDNVMDMDEKVAHVYCDGQLLGTINLAQKGLGVITGFRMSVKGSDAYYDNIRIRTLGSSYGAKLTASGSKLYIDFDETTTALTSDSFTVTKAGGILGNAETLTASLIYQNGTRAVLQLGENIEDGKLYTVTFNNVASFLGNSIEPSVVLNTAVQGDEKVETIVNDDMSSYTAENIFADGSPWKYNNSIKTENISFPEEGGLKLTVEDSERMEYHFDEVKSGKIEMEVKFNGATQVEYDSATTGTALEYLGIVFGNPEYFFAQLHNKNGLVLPTSKQKSQKEYNWCGQAYTQGEDVTVKYIYDFASGKSYVYRDGTVLLNGTTYPLAISSGSADDIAGIKALKLVPVGKTGLPTALTVKSIKVTHTYSKAAVGNIAFADVNGNTYPASGVSAKSNQMLITYPDGMLNDTFNGNVEIKCGDETLTYTGSWNSASNIYTLTFDRLLGEGKTYEIKAYGSVGKTGKEYIDESGSFTTLNDGAFEVSGLDYTKTESSVNVTLKAVNSKDAKTVYVIYAGYNGGRLAHMDCEALTLEKDANPNKTVTFEDTASYDRTAVYVWDGFGTMTPVTGAVSK